MKLNHATTVVCPQCGHDCVHPGLASWHPVGDDYDPENPLSTRGNWGELSLRCEEGHTTRLVVAFHKGTTYLLAQDTTATAPDFDGRTVR